MVSRYYFGTVDYVVLILTLVLSAAIGIVFHFSDGKQRTTKEYLLAGKNMAQFPVILSIAVTITSTVTMLGTPAETYRYGLQHIASPFGVVLGMLLSSYVFVPVYFQCGVQTVYEFLELRYGKYTRLTVSALFLVQMVLFMAVVLYGPALALSAVTNLTLTSSILIFGGVCTFYCVLGGLKAVIWTDAVQALLMFICMIAFYTTSIEDAGGIANIHHRAAESKRLQLFNFNLDLTARYTSLNSFMRGLSLGLSSYGTSQLEVQRMLSLSHSCKASRALRISTVPVISLHLMCYLAGLVLYAIYYSCDPVLNSAHTGLNKYDQILPYYIVNRFGTYPGLTGLCVAGIFSGSLSTVSSALNSLATVTIVDFIEPVFKLSERRNVVLAKIFSFFYGLTCICLTFSFVNVQSLKQLGVTLVGTLEGPMFAIFLFGVLTQRVSEKSVLIGTFLSLPIICCIGFGSLISGYIEPPLELKSTNCSAAAQEIDIRWGNTTDCCNNSTTTPTIVPIMNDTFILFKISYLWFPVIGCVCASFMVFVTTYIFGSKENVIESNSNCLSPVTKLWKKRSIYQPTYQSADEHELKGQTYSFQKDVASILTNDA